MPDNMKSRLESIRRVMATLEADAFLVTNLHNVSYLTGFTGSSGFVVVTAGAAYFITDFRYETQAAEEVSGFDVIIHRAGWTDNVVALAGEHSVKSLAYESAGMNCETFSTLSGRLEGVRMLPSKDAVERMRMVKDEEELSRITEAVKRAERGFAENASRVSPGMTENEVALGLEFNIRSLGARKVPFDIIVASGPRAAMPHGLASGRELRDGETVIIDFGGEADGYQSDITRSGVLGEPDLKQNEVFDIVREAQQRAIEAVRPGVTGKEVDAAARDFIASRGYGDNFGHGLGHGVGLEVHEGPRISPMGQDVLEPGMVFTVEPGVYLPGWGGFRIEDMVVVTEDGCRVLTSLSRGIDLKP
jgi:Xaa-Pro aminopeptidase